METVEPVWDTTAGGISTIATQNSSGVGTYYINQPPENLFDNNTSTQYTTRGNSSAGSNNYAGINTGFYVTIAQCQPVLVMFRFATGTMNSTCDPITLTIEGTDCDDLSTCTNWSTIYTSTTGLENVLNRTTYGTFQYIPAPQVFSSYRFLVTSKRGMGIFVSYSEVELYGY
jgi:hypothetical protein